MKLIVSLTGNSVRRGREERDFPAKEQPLKEAPILGQTTFANYAVFILTLLHTKV